jgi:hypothetical protein
LPSSPDGGTAVSTSKTEAACHRGRWAGAADILPGDRDATARHPAKAAIPQGRAQRADAKKGALRMRGRMREHLRRDEKLAGARRGRERCQA